MAIVFIWEDAYSVGNRELDEQHRRIFRMANELPEEMTAPLVRTKIMALYKHVREHFETEERMMARIGYPRMDSHRELHMELISKLNELSARPLEEDGVAVAFKRLVYDWAMDHIMTQDLDYFRFAQQKNKAER